MMVDEGLLVNYSLLTGVSATYPAKRGKEQTVRTTRKMSLAELFDGFRYLLTKLCCFLSFYNLIHNYTSVTNLYLFPRRGIMDYEEVEEINLSISLPEEVYAIRSLSLDAKRNLIQSLEGMHATIL